MTETQPGSMEFPPLPAEPQFSIIVPIRNEAAFIEKTLEAIVRQSYPMHLIEVIVADGQSDDDTRAVVRHYAENHAELRLALIDNPNRIFSSGFNAGLAIVQGDIVGGHSQIAPDFVENNINLLKETDAACSGGVIHTIGQSTIGTAISLGMSTWFGVGGVTFRISTDAEFVVREVDTVAFGAYRREVFDRIGQLDEELVRNQDDEFNYRLRKQGGRILFSSAIQTTYHSRSSLPRLRKQYYQYGFWKVRVMQKHPRQMRMRHFVPVAFVATLMILAILALFQGVFQWLFLAIIGLYAIASLVVSFKIASKEGWKYIIWLPVVFAALHFSYGTGFLVGLVEFRNGWRKA